MKFILTAVLICLTTVTFAQATVNDKQLTKEGVIYLYEGKPFTGDAYGYAGMTGDPIIRHFVEGLQTGIFTGYFDEERTRVKWMVPIINGKQNGQFVHYHENGTVSFTSSIKDDKAHGRRYCFTDEGLLWHIHNYRKGKEHGPYTVYYQDTGNLHVEKNYRRDSLHGAYAAYSQEGILKGSGRYKKGKKHGVWKFYNEDGSLRQTEIYRRDELKDFFQYR